MIGHHQRVGGIAGELEAGEPAGLVGGQLQRLHFGGDRHVHADEAGLHRHFAQLVERRQALGDEEALRMAVVAAAPVRHRGDRQHLDHDAVFALQPVLQRRQKIVAAEKLAEGFGLFLDRGEMVRAALENLAHLVDRQAGGGDRRPALARQQVRQIRQTLRLLAIGAVELDDGGRRIGRAFGELDQFLVARQFAGQQRIGKRPRAGRRPRRRLALQFVRLDLEDRGELEDELHRQRPLVALDQVEIGGRDAERLGHRRLGQALARCGSRADARPAKIFCSAIRHAFTTSLD